MADLKCTCPSPEHPKSECPVHDLPDNPLWERLYRQAVKACEEAQVAIDDIAGWSGSSGNWPLHEASIRIRKAIQAFREPTKGET